MTESDRYVALRVLMAAQEHLARAALYLLMAEPDMPVARVQLRAKVDAACLATDELRKLIARRGRTKRGGKRPSFAKASEG